MYVESMTEGKRVDEQLAQALARERLARARAEATERHLAFLARVGRVLIDSLDYETILERIARLAVPAIADVCIINVVEADGSVQRIAEAHVDPAKEPLLRALRKFPPRLDSDHPVSQAIRTRQPQVHPEYPWEKVEAAAYDDEHVRLLHELGFTSVIVVPLIARDSVLGAISLHGISLERRLTEEDLPLAEALARRGAIAIDNARLYAAQERARTEAEAAVRLRDAFLASVTHDLKNPLTVIKGYSHLLRRMVVSPEPENRHRLMDILSRIDAATSRMVRLLDELLDVARLEIGQPLVLEYQPTDLVALARQTALTHQQEAEHCVIRVETDLPRLIGLWDPARLERVLDNIVANAVKYSARDAEITIRIDRQESWAVLEVQDPGIGIPAEDLDRVFERFHRGRNVHGRIPGTGLGLWGSRLVVEQHGGTIGLRSQEGEGTTVIVRLPLREPPPQETSG